MEEFNGLCEDLLTRETWSEGMSLGLNLGTEPSKTKAVEDFPDGAVDKNPPALVSVCTPSRVRLFATPWTVAHQAPRSTGILQARILE